MSKPNDLKQFFPDPQGYELFRAACRMSDGLIAELQKSKAETARARTARAVGQEVNAQTTAADALSSLWGLRSSSPDRRADVRKFARKP